MEYLPETPTLTFAPNMLVEVRKLIGLDSGLMKQSVDILEDWVKKQNHFVNKDIGRRYYETTLLACKGSVEKAKSQIDKICTFRTLLPKYFITSNLKENLKRISQLSCVIPMPKITDDYHRICYIKIFNEDFDSSDFLHYYRLIIAISEYLKAHDYVNGFVLIQDLREAKLLEIMTKVNFVEFQQFMTVLIEGYGARLKGIHLISESKVLELFAKTFKTVLSPKIANRLYIHPNMDSISSIVDTDLLPADVGGKEKSINELQEQWLEELGSEENEKYLARMKNSKTDESLRHTDKFNEQYMGMPGSFRTLTVD